MHLYLLCTISALLYAGVQHVQAHGRLTEPPSRSTMWRYGYPTETNYNDNQLFCGGFVYQWASQGGNCGVCGDPFDGPWPNEAGGKYASGIIVRQFSVGSEFDIGIEITANHWGWFEFRLCANNDPTQIVTHECLNENLLLLSDGTTRFYLPNHDYKVFWVKAELPDGLTCTQCVLQWKYHTANSWGVDDDGTECVGCGPQEEFYGCADIAIGEGDMAYNNGENPDGSNPGPPDDGGEQYTTEIPIIDLTTASPIITPTEDTRTLAPQVTTEMPVEPTPVAPVTTEMPVEPTPVAPVTTELPVEPTPVAPVTTEMPGENNGENPDGSNPGPEGDVEPTTAISSGGCVGVGVWVDVAGIGDWCDVNCPENCPVELCSCCEPSNLYNSCEATGDWVDVAGIDIWCQHNCEWDCPKFICTCPCV